MTFLRTFMLASGVLATTALGGCSTTGFKGLSSGAPSRTVMAEMASIKTLDPVKACLRPSVAGMRISILPSINNTGKTNSVSDAGTGDYLTGTQTGNFVITMLKDELGITVQALNNTGVELFMRQYGTTQSADARAKALANAPAKYQLIITPMSLDFVKTRNATLMVKGIGGYTDMQRATISGGATLLKGNGSYDVAGYGAMKMSVFSSQNGLQVGRIWGNTLVTGEAGVGSQDPMQLWSGEFVANIAALKALTNTPEGKHCDPILKKIVGPDEVSI